MTFGDPCIIYVIYERPGTGACYHLGVISAEWPRPSSESGAGGRRRLRVARRAAGFSLRGLAAAMDGIVTAQAIGGYERGEIAPSPPVLAALAHALGTPEAYFRDGPAMKLLALHFRTKVRVGQRTRTRIQAAALKRMDAYCGVEEQLGLPSASWAPPRGVPFPVGESGAEVEFAAISLRRHWGLGLRPVGNVAEALEENGVKIVVLDLPRGLDGACVTARTRDGQMVPGIVVSQRGPRERQRFTMAHELGHLTLRASPRADAEGTADRFAGALLMPAETVWSEVGRHRTHIGWDELFKLKRLFGVSVQALTHRCSQLGVFRTSLSRRLFEEFRCRGWSVPPYQEPGATMELERPERFGRLCMRAVAEEASSAVEAAGLLGASISEVALRMETPPVDGDAEGDAATLRRRGGRTSDRREPPLGQGSARRGRGIRGAPP